jgi:hypothetical protein
MRSRRRSREAEVDPFYDMLFNMLIALSSASSSRCWP